MFIVLTSAANGHAVDIPNFYHNIRAKSITLLFLCIDLWQFFNLYVKPVAIDTGWKCKANLRENIGFWQASSPLGGILLTRLNCLQTILTRGIFKFLDILLV
jgi:hypothetical protein